jgi:hypothetical protein
LKPKDVPRNLDEHEGTICIKGRVGQWTAVHIPFPQLGPTATREVVDPVLRLDPLVEVLVSGKDDIKAVLTRE